MNYEPVASRNLYHFGDYGLAGLGDSCNRMRQPAIYESGQAPPTVIIVMDRPGGWAIKDKNGTAAIFVEGEMINGKILPNRQVLAHEIMHLMNWEDKAFLNPDGE